MAHARLDALESLDAWPLACPVCDAGMSRTATSVVCPNGHAFDVAREGYVNLLPSSHRTRGIEGDTREMVQARRRFLEGVYYGPLLERLRLDVAAVLSSAVAAAGSLHDPCVLEVGCGDGYYVGNLARALHGPDRQGATFLGADLSKPAVKLAARSHTSVRFFVADTKRRIYVHDASVTILLDVFAPRNPLEFARVVKPGGVALVVIPAPGHLAALRSARGLLGIQEDKEGKVLAQLAPGFALADRQELTFSIDLSADAMRDLVNMGPNRWHEPDLSTDDEEGTISTEASFVILRLQRRDRGC